MASSYLTEYGLDIPNYSEWLEEYFTLTRDVFGVDVNLEDNSILNKFLSIHAYQDMKIWNAISAVYSSQTLNGAEGIYLDEIFSRRGLFRKAATAAYGYATIATNSSTPWGTVIASGYSFFDNAGNIFIPTSDTQTVKDRVSAFSVSRTELLGQSTIKFFMYSNTTNTLVSQIFTTASPTIMDDLTAFFASNVTSVDVNSVFNQEDTLYVGFSQESMLPTGLFVPTAIYADKDIGVKYSDINVQCVSKGFLEVNVGNISNVVPTPTGYVTMTNFKSFTPGTNVETDAEYRSRFNDTVDQALVATKSAIIGALYDVEGVTKVKIYDNPTTIDKTEAPAYTFHTIVLGGSAEDIATTLYTTKPINTLTTGDISYNVDTEDGSIEIIKFSYCIPVSYEIQISYITTNDNALNESEKTTITNALTDLASEFTIGGTIFNAQLQSAVFSSVGYSRLKGLTVGVKKTDATDYETTNILSEYYEIPTFTANAIHYQQTF